MLKPLQLLNRGDVTKVFASVIVSGAAAAEQRLGEVVAEAVVKVMGDYARKAGVPRLRMEDVEMRRASAAEEVCEVIESGAAVDRYMADQICVYLAMARGRSDVVVGRPSSHLRSVVEVCGKFGVDIQLEEIYDGNGNCILSCEGVGVLLPS